MNTNQLIPKTKASATATSPPRRQGCQRCQVAALLAVVMLLAKFNTLASVIPLSPDANTLHLWHMNETTVPLLDSATTGATNLFGLTNGATLGNASFAGFGNALSTYDGGPNGVAAANKDATLGARHNYNLAPINWTYFDPTTTAFTYECIVRIDFGPTNNLGTTANGGNNRNGAMQLISLESNSNPGRVFQWRLDPVGFVPNSGIGTPLTQPALEFINLRLITGNYSVFAFIPTNGPDAILSNNWYHVAVTYNGTPNVADNIIFYWTLLDAARTNASRLTNYASVQSILTNNVSASTAGNLCIGNIGRTANNNFVGLIDEVRISNIARDPAAMIFGPPAATIISGPSNAVVAVNQPASFSVLAVGGPPLVYHWRFNGTNLPNATNTSYSIGAAQLTDAGPYDVVVSNSVNAVTSSVATLTVRTPLNVTWLGPLSADWDTLITSNWLDSVNLTNAYYSTGDNVLFDAAGSAQPNVNLVGSLTPSSVTVSADSDYTLSSTVGGSISGITGLTKSGAGRLTVDTDNNFSGPTVIQNGTLQLGLADAHGALGSGSISNGGILIFARTSDLNINGAITGTGSITNNNSAFITLNGTNTCNGPVTLNTGVLTVSGNNGLGNFTNVTVNPANRGDVFGTRFSLAGGANFPANGSMLLGAGGTSIRSSLFGTGGGTNTVACPITIADFNGVADTVNNVVCPVADTASVLSLTGPISGPDFVGKIVMRGTGNGFISGQVNLPNGHLSKTDGGIWTISSTGNYWTNTDCAGGPFRMGATGALPTNINMNFTGGSLDLAGYNQQIASISGSSGPIASSSTNSDCVFTLNTASTCLYGGAIQNSMLGGTKKVGFTLVGGSLTLTGTNSFSGDTTITSGTLALVSNGALSNTANLIVAAGSTLDASGRSDGTLTINPGQTLKGDGTFTVTGNLTSLGTIELKVNKFGAVLTNDMISGISTLTYGGTLKLDVTASPALTTGDSFTLFSAGSYGGIFGNIVPPVPVSGFAWDTSTLTIDGVLRIKTGPATNPTNITAVVVGGGGTLELDWPADHTGWRLQAQTNPPSAGLSTNWHDVPGSYAVNQVLMPINPANGSVFYRLIYP